MLLIHPPAAKPSEPPAGIARLAGFLRSRGAACRLVDLNMEAVHFFLGGEVSPSTGGPDYPQSEPDTFTRRAIIRRDRNLALLRGPAGYTNRGRYRQAVSELERLLSVRSAYAAVSAGCGAQVLARLADYSDTRLSPLRSTDLLAAAAEPERNAYFPFFSRRLAGLLERETTDGSCGVPVVGISIGFLSQALTAFAIAGFIRRRYPKARLVLGGGLITSWMRSAGWRDDLFRGLIDRCIAGPGETELLAFLTPPANGSVRGSALLGTPDYRGLVGLPYLAPGTILPYAGSSGCCWNRCTFCPERAEGGPYLPVPADRVISELRALVQEHHPVLIHLLDSEVNPALLRHLAENPPGAPWYGFARISPELGDRDFARALASSGCTMLKLGIESGDQPVLNETGKGIRTEDAARALEALAHAGIMTYVYLLFGTPAETPEAARRTLAFTARHAAAIDYLNLAVFNLPAGSPEARRLPTREFYDGDLSLYRDFAHPAGWNRDRVRAFLDHEFRRHPAIAPILRRTPPVFTSNHAPLFHSRNRNRPEGPIASPASGR